MLGSALAQINIDLAKATINDIYVCELKLEDTISLLGEATSVTGSNSIFVNEYTPTHAHYANDGISFMFIPSYPIDKDDKQSPLLATVTIFLTGKTPNSNKISPFSGRFLPKVNLSWSILEAKHWFENNFSSESKVSITSAKEMRELYVNLPEWYQVLYLRNQVYYHGVTRESDSHGLTLAYSEHSKALELIIIGCSQ